MYANAHTLLPASLCGVRESYSPGHTEGFLSLRPPTMLLSAVLAFKFIVRRVFQSFSPRQQQLFAIIPYGSGLESSPNLSENTCFLRMWWGCTWCSGNRIRPSPTRLSAFATAVHPRTTSFRWAQYWSEPHRSLLIAPHKQLPSPSTNMASTQNSRMSLVRSFVAL